MKNVLYVIIFISVFLYVSKISIQIKPFKVSFGDLLFGIGWLFLFAAIVLIQVSAYRKGSLSGYDDALNDVLKYQNEKNKSENQHQ